MAAHSPSNPLAPNFLDRAINAIAPMAGVRRMAAKRLLHEFKYDGASFTNRRENAPAQIAPNSFQVQRDRLQLLREATDLENNFAPAKTLNRKYAMYVAPQGYHAQTGDTMLDAAVEEWLNHEWFPKCDHANRADFFRLLEFGVLGMNRGGDYGWVFTRPGSDPSMSPDELIQLPFRLQAIEPDRLGGVYQNIVSEDYVSGVLIGDHGQPVAYRVFKRGMAAGQYTDPIDVPASQFVHYMDAMQLDAYRGVSKLDAAVANLRDLYEMIEFTKGKAKLASALTIFTNSTGATAGIGAMDGYASSQFDNQQSAMAQDIQFGQINHLTAGQDIKFADTSSPGPESQYLMTMLLKMTCMSYNLPYSFGLDATNLGGVSSRLESEQAKAEFTRGQRVLSPLAHRMKDAALMDAIAKGIFPVSSADKICRGRWSYRPHPQPDIGRESSANVSLFQSGLLNPLNYWTEDAQDPEKVASDMVRWAKIKRDKAAAEGFTVEEVFGSGMAKPTNISQSESVSTVAPTPGTEPDATTTEASARMVNEFDVKIDAEDLRAATLRELVSLLMDKIPRNQAIAAAYAIYDGDKTRAQLLKEVESHLQGLQKDK